MNAKQISTPKTKRARNVETPTSSNNKSPKILKLIELKYAKQNELMMTTIEECVKTSVGYTLSDLNKQTESLQTAIKETEERILSQINNKLLDLENRLLTDLNERVNKIDEEIKSINERVVRYETESADISEVKSEIKKIKSQINKQENLTVSCDLRIMGIPSSNAENLNELFNNICSALNIPTPPYKNIYRIQTNKKSFDGTILVQLFSPYDRNFILKTLSNFRKNTKSQFCLNNIGFDSNKPIYVNENLTSCNFKILQSALKLKRQKNISSAYSLRGLIYIKIKPTDEPIMIEDISDLSHLFRNNYGDAAFHNC